MTAPLNTQRFMLILGAVSCLACASFSQYLYSHDLSVSHHGTRAAGLHRHVNTARL
jgi:hypothetical protein